MTRKTTTLWALTALLMTFSFAMAQPKDGERPPRDDRERERRARDGEERPRGPRDGARPRGREFGPPPNPLMMAIDVDHDGKITTEEMEGAAAALKKLDKNEDGILDREELAPEPRERDGEGRPGRGPGDRPEGDRPPRGRGPEGRGAGGGSNGFIDRMMESDADGDGKLSRDELEKASERFRGGRGGRGGQGRPGSDRPQRPE